MRHIKACLSIMFILFAGSDTINAQDKTPAEMKQIVESRNYIFKAESVSPQMGGSRVLTSDYDLTITGDTIIAYLPYFGRAYTAPINPSEGGIKFTSTDFTYNVVKKSKSWEIAIKPKDADDVQQVYLDVFENGSANLRVNSLNRQSISYNGYIKERRSISKKSF